MMQTKSQTKSRKYCPICGQKLEYMRLLSEQDPANNSFMMTYFCDHCSVKNGKQLILTVRRRGNTDPYQAMSRIAKRLRRLKSKGSTNDDDDHLMNSRKKYCHDCGERNRNSFCRSQSAISSNDNKFLCYYCGECSKENKPLLFAIQTDNSTPFTQLRLTIVGAKKEVKGE